ncbi:uncharacterized protein CMU_011410 [Cryptosporidium muris RN66]|uniref:Exostosin family protein n=1 Tax=Cryptosporidium muris (strain RN66) TaxID=441375 RepID=B6AJ01_CRYMR|nr:uncharacterized protein CMU_011410 [Cryptosporidium muris RN66]EEA08192.1 hypothetical protein CMU_011410 [Cryptosporidium muris RN66]|eukprot:XP_002142541.1 hypothetical protein [Cryptosporidium muris RN66]
MIAKNKNLRIILIITLTAIGVLVVYFSLVHIFRNSVSYWVQNKSQEILVTEEMPQDLNVGNNQPRILMEDNSDSNKRLQGWNPVATKRGPKLPVRLQDSDQELYEETIKPREVEGNSNYLVNIRNLLNRIISDNFRDKISENIEDDLDILYNELLPFILSTVTVYIIDTDNYLRCFKKLLDIRINVNLNIQDSDIIITSLKGDSLNNLQKQIELVRSQIKSISKSFTNSKTKFGLIKMPLILYIMIENNIFENSARNLLNLRENEILIKPSGPLNDETSTYILPPIMEKFDCTPDIIRSDGKIETHSNYLSILDVDHLDLSDPTQRSIELLANFDYLYNELIIKQKFLFNLGIKDIINSVTLKETLIIDIIRNMNILKTINKKSNWIIIQDSEMYNKIEKVNSDISTDINKYLIPSSILKNAIFCLVLDPIRISINEDISLNSFWDSIRYGCIPILLTEYGLNNILPYSRIFYWPDFVIEINISKFHSSKNIARDLANEIVHIINNKSDIEIYNMLIKITSIRRLLFGSNGINLMLAEILRDLVMDIIQERNKDSK